MQATTITLGALVADASLQPRRDGLDANHVRALEQARDSWPPVTVVQHEGAYLLVDGFHRFAAAQNLGLDSIEVEIIALPDDGDLRGLAFELNAKHGRPLSLDDRRAEAQRILAAHPPTSNMEVSRRVGLSPSTVASIRESLERAEAIEPAGAAHRGWW